MDGRPHCGGGSRLSAHFSIEGRARPSAHSTAIRGRGDVYSNKDRAVLHNAAGVQIASLGAAEIACFEFRARRGEVERFTKKKKGQLVLVFQLRESLGRGDPRGAGPMRFGSPAALTNRDSEGIAGCGAASRAQVERWFGWGLLAKTGGGSSVERKGNA